MMRDCSWAALWVATRTDKNATTHRIQIPSAAAGVERRHLKNSAPTSVGASDAKLEAAVQPSAFTKYAKQLPRDAR